MNPDEVVVHDVKRDHRNVVLNLFAEGIREPSKAAHRHAHGEVLALHVGRADMSRIGIAVDNLRLAADALGWAITLLALRCFVVKLHKLCVVYLAVKCLFDSLQVDAKAIAG